MFTILFVWFYLGCIAIGTVAGIGYLVNWYERWQHKLSQPVESVPSRAMREAEEVASAQWHLHDKWERKVKDNR